VDNRGQGSLPRGDLRRLFFATATVVVRALHSGSTDRRLEPLRWSPADYDDVDRPTMGSLWCVRKVMTVDLHFLLLLQSD
jgi:hypothetical protein